VSPLDAFLAVVSAVASVLAIGWAFVRSHRHPENPTRAEMDAEIDGLKALLRANHASVLRELSALRTLIESIRQSRR